MGLARQLQINGVTAGELGTAGTAQQQACAPDARGDTKSGGESQCGAAERAVAVRVAGECGESRKAGQQHGRNQYRDHNGGQ